MTPRLGPSAILVTNPQKKEQSHVRTPVCADMPLLYLPTHSNTQCPEEVAAIRALLPSERNLLKFVCGSGSLRRNLA